MTLRSIKVSNRSSFTGFGLLSSLLVLTVSLGCQQHSISHLATGDNESCCELEEIKIVKKETCCDDDVSSSSTQVKNESHTHAIDYEIPNVTLVDQFGKNQNLQQILNSEKPIALNFIFTTCTTICPVMTTSFKGFQKELENNESQTRLISISLDPEFDTPEKLSNYATRYQANTNWLFLTGNSGDMRQVHDAFHALTGSKFNHKPFTLFRKSKAEKWHRVEGLLGIEKLIDAHENIVKEAS